MANTNDISPTNPYYHEEVTYDSKKENWSGLTSLLMVPLFIGLVAWGIVSTFQLPIRNDIGGSNQNNLQIGVGGGPENVSPTPYKVPSITITPGRLSPSQGSDSGLYYIQ